jgi:hypothetical protein
MGGGSLDRAGAVIAAAYDRPAVKRKEQQGLIPRRCSGFGPGQIAQLHEHGGGSWYSQAVSQGSQGGPAAQVGQRSHHARQAPNRGRLAQVSSRASIRVICTLQGPQVTPRM